MRKWRLKRLASIPCSFFRRPAERLHRRLQAFPSLSSLNLKASVRLGAKVSFLGALSSDLFGEARVPRPRDARTARPGALPDVGEGRRGPEHGATAAAALHLGLRLEAAGRRRALRLLQGAGGGPQPHGEAGDTWSDGRRELNAHWL